MPIAPIIAVVLGTGESSMPYRTLVLVDAKSGVKAYAKFGRTPADEEASEDSVAQLFDSSLTTLTTTNEVIFDSNTLPILRYIGRWTETIVTRTKTGTIEIRDAVPKAADSYMGIGG